MVHTALEATVWNLEPADRSAVRRRWNAAHPGDEQQLRLEPEPHVLGADPGQRHNDKQLALALEQVDRGLPTCRRQGREAGPEELPMQLFRPFDHGGSYIERQRKGPLYRVQCWKSSSRESQTGSVETASNCARFY